MDFFQPYQYSQGSLILIVHLFANKINFIMLMFLSQHYINKMQFATYCVQNENSQLKCNTDKWKQSIKLGFKFLSLISIENSNALQAYFLLTNKQTSRANVTHSMCLSEVSDSRFRYWKYIYIADSCSFSSSK